jgi:2',3'-cyclic-nucleotide 2'-phosphodiesterase
MKILCIGDIVGKPGRKLVSRLVPDLRRERGIDFCVANGENAAGGSGLTPKVLRSLLGGGVDVVTSGDHVYKNKEVFACFGEPALLRPLNYVERAEGRGAGLYQAAGARILVANLQGRVFMDPAECPFAAVDRLLEKRGAEADVILVDMHAEATSEKIAMGWHLDGRASAVVGTHTHVQTADARILPKGTAYLTDLGMTGPFDSVLGRDTASVLHRFTTQMPARFEVAENDLRLSGCIVEIDPADGRASAIERLELRADDL